MNKSHNISKNAFTLLEMVITMMIISIIMGSAFFAFSTDSNNPLKTLAPEIETLSTRAVRTSVKDKKSQYIILTASKILHTDIPELPEETTLESVNNSVTLPTGVSISYKRPTDKDWNTISERSDPVIWIISRSGISEKIEMRLNFEDAVYEMTFDPLTGNLDENREHP